MRIIVGNDATVDYSLYGWDNSRADRYRKKLNGYKHVFTEYGNKTLNAITNIYDSFTSDRVIRNAKRKLREVSSAYNQDIIVLPKNLARANRKTRRYIMADKILSDLYSRNIIDGYSDTDYNDTVYDREVIRNTVLDGIHGDDDAEVGCLHYMSGIEHYDELDIEDQDEVIKAWKLARESITMNIDPTDS